MTARRLAVIDLGSNTFHLLIIETDPDRNWKPIYKDRRYVKLASAGLEEIDEASLDRAISAMKEFADVIRQYEVDQTHAIGTAAMREARNGRMIARQIEATCGIEVEIIDGHAEADYILRGIRSTLPPLDKSCLIMDIGGGSVEFILFNPQTIQFVGSFKIGVAVLFRKFHHSDPIAYEEIQALESFLAEQLSPLIQALKANGPYYLVGASGSFEVIRDAMPALQEKENWAQLHQEWLLAYLDEVIQTDLERRKRRKEIPAERMDYIVVAYLLIRYLIREAWPDRLYYCDFALKEGVIAKILEQELS